MRTPEQAIATILGHAEPLGEVELVSLHEAAGRVLAREIVSDLDLPPFRKSAMDGYALRASELAGGGEDGARLRQVGESSAGRPFSGAVPSGACIAIYTGAEVPDDCDAVVMVERSEREGELVRLRDAPRPGQNICNRGEDLRVGQAVAGPGRRLTPTDLSVLASVGCEPVPCFRRPRVAVLTTGDELVAPDERPGPGQIREGNTYHLAALARRAGAEVVEVARVPDDERELARRFAAAVERCDAVVTSGGVSMGRYDLVADVFRSVGVEEVFHKVAIKPGKPIWFGRAARTLVFALPGNPVSCLLDHEVFVRPALARLAGAGPQEQVERRRRGRWRGGAIRPNPRQQNLPVLVSQSDDGVDDLVPVPWTSSADIVGLARASGMAIVPAGEAIDTGAMVDYRPLS